MGSFVLIRWNSRYSWQRTCPRDQAAIDLNVLPVRLDVLYNAETLDGTTATPIEMDKLTLTLLPTAKPALTTLRALLDDFGARFHMQIDCRVLEWSEAWTQYTGFATYGDCPDVSEVGTTWIGPLAAMEALRQFTDTDLAPIGGAAAFHDPMWRTGISGGSVWALPWWVDTRLIWYWRDSLATAGVTEADAFDTHEKFLATLEQLRASGASAWVATTQPSSVTLQNVASWIWAYGGDLLDPNGQRVIIDQPEALKGLKAYFDLHRFIAPAFRGRTDVDCDRAFAEHRAAVTVAGPWLAGTISEVAGRAAFAQLGTAPMPGRSFVGGSSLVIWRRSLQVLPALDLIRFLNTQSVIYTLTRAGIGLPSRLDVLTDSGLAQDPLYRVLSANALRGRSFANTRLWTTIETQLSNTLAVLWRAVLAQPDMPVTEALLLRHLQPVVRRLNTMHSR